MPTSRKRKTKKPPIKQKGRLVMVACREKDVPELVSTFGTGIIINIGKIVSDLEEKTGDKLRWGKS